MRLLFDEQVSSRLPRLLADSYPDSLHIDGLGLAGVPRLTASVPRPLSRMVTGQAAPGRRAYRPMPLRHYNASI